MTVLRAGAGSGDCRVEAVAVQCGRDLSVCICGGTGHHIGASALAIPRPSLRDPQRCSATTSVLAVTGHKEDELAKQAAARLASAFDCRVSVQAGLHVDGASPEEIQRLWENYEAALGKLEEKLRPQYGKTEERGH